MWNIVLNFVYPFHAIHYKEEGSCHPSCHEVREKAACQQLNTSQTTNTFIVMRNLFLTAFSCIEMFRSENLHINRKQIYIQAMCWFLVLLLQIQVSTIFFWWGLSIVLRQTHLAVLRVKDTGFVFAQQIWFWRLTLVKGGLTQLDRTSQTFPAVQGHIYVSTSNSTRQSKYFRSLSQMRNNIDLEKNSLSGYICKTSPSGFPNTLGPHIC